MSFKVGDMAVYPAHGVGIIHSIETKSISGGRRESFYVMRILDTGITIMVPVSNTEQVGLRRIMDSRAVSSVYKILRAREIDVE
ncbi:MAG TPA: CarD family transcriptional regulator, partial [Candidatus Deferrimicrobiaceae bacterium]|nr:CarD family transcriptional regulator [Candidatus Deferrimicrobiaceae bacterium]